MKKLKVFKVLSLPVTILLGFSIKAKVAMLISSFATFVAKTSVFATWFFTAEEPKMPKSLYEKK